jgi:hypothetical protein
MLMFMTMCSFQARSGSDRQEGHVAQLHLAEGRADHAGADEQGEHALVLAVVLNTSSAARWSSGMITVVVATGEPPST